MTWSLAKDLNSYHHQKLLVGRNILNSHLQQGCLQFPINWEGYGYEENSWVSEDNVYALAKVQEFY